MKSLMVTLHGRGQVHGVGADWWVALTSLAVDNGWQPTQESRSDRPEALCELILGRVTDADAKAMADALERSLADIPDHDALAAHPRRGLSWDERYAGGPFLSNPPSLLEWFSGPNKQMVRDLIRFARRGGFRVEDPTL